MSMEQRLFIAFALSLAVLFGFQSIFAPTPPIKHKKSQRKKQDFQKNQNSSSSSKNNRNVNKQEEGNKKNPPSPKNGEHKPSSKKKNPLPASTSKLASWKAVEGKPFFIETDLYKIEFHPKGAYIKSLVLKKYKEQDQKTPLELLKPYPTVFHSFALYDYEKLKAKEDKEKSSLDPARNIQDELAFGYWKILKKDSKEVVFEKYLKNKKILVQKTFHLYPKKYQISLSLKFQNLSEKKQNFEYRLNGPCGIAPEETFYIRLQGYIAKKNGDDSPLDLTFLSDSSLKESSPVYQESFKNISWVGVGNKYFAGLLYPNNIPSRVGGIGHFEMPHIKGRKKEYSLYSFFVPRGLDLPPKDPKEESYLIYIGPKDPKILEHYQQEGFDQVISYGWWIFAVFTKLFLAILKFFYFHIYPNYGLAIIFLTFLVKLCLLPLDYKAQKSMMMMQKLQPKMAAIQKKYKGKKGAENMQKQQQEIMQLYQEHGVNPLGGCLPMLLQLPVFIGLYQAFNMDISLRQASFFGWIKDLSMPDSLVTFAEPVHFLFFTFGGIHILPMIMVVLMVVQQMLQPKTDDPQQQQQRKMFMFMMVFMGLIFYNFPSGLVLYFICQSLVSLAEQKIIQRKLKAAEEGVS